MIRISQLKIDVLHNEKQLVSKICKILGIHKDKLIMGSGSNNDPYRTE